MMNFQKATKIIIYVTCAAWIVVLGFNAGDIKPAWKALSAVTTAATVIALVIDRWLWKFSVFQTIVNRPFIGGTWRVTLKSTWIDPATGLGIAPIEAYMVVRQTLSSLSMRLLTAESNSELVGTEIISAADGIHCVSGVYRNEPRLEVRGRSAIHFGAVWLQIVTEPHKEIFGHYWTDRNTSGEMILTSQQGVSFQTFAAAQKHFAALVIAAVAAAPVTS
jgi:hypothetical protein